MVINALTTAATQAATHLNSLPSCYQAALAQAAEASGVPILLPITPDKLFQLLSNSADGPGGVAALAYVNALANLTVRSCPAPVYDTPALLYVDALASLPVSYLSNPWHTIMPVSCLLPACPRCQTDPLGVCNVAGYYSTTRPTIEPRSLDGLLSKVATFLASLTDGSTHAGITLCSSKTPGYANLAGARRPIWHVPSTALHLAHASLLCSCLTIVKCICGTTHQPETRLKTFPSFFKDFG